MRREFLRNLHNSAGSGGDTGPQVGALFTNGTGDGRALHFTLGIDNDTSVIFKVKEDAVPSTPSLPLADNYGGHDLLPQLGFPLLDCSHEHVANTAGGQPVKTPMNTLDGYNVQVLGARVVSTVHDSTNGQT